MYGCMRECEMWGCEGRREMVGTTPAESKEEEGKGGAKRKIDQNTHRTQSTKEPHSRKRHQINSRPSDPKTPSHPPSASSFLIDIGLGDTSGFVPAYSSVRMNQECSPRPFGAFTEDIDGVENGLHELCVREVMEVWVVPSVKRPKGSERRLDGFSCCFAVSCVPFDGALMRL
jgi:hypothetical protein